MLLCTTALTVIRLLVILLLPARPIGKWIGTDNVPQESMGSRGEEKNSTKTAAVGPADAKKHHRSCVRFEREVRAEYGAGIAWFCKPSVFRSVFKILCALRFLQRVEKTLHVFRHDRAPLLARNHMNYHVVGSKALLKDIFGILSSATFCILGFCITSLFCQSF